MELDINLFYFWMVGIVILFYFTLITHAGLRMALGWITVGILLALVAFFIKGGTITKTFITVTDVTTINTVPLSFGISNSILVIIFVLFALVAMSLAISTS